ncbi:MAG: DUF308 domain-containing protein [Butyrivibrio sp.]|nr:DUF308 domain-containing protein [Butyrivibrio sp.]
MTKFQRLKNLIYGLLLIASGMILLYIPENAFVFLLLLLSTTLLISGINTLTYYFTMARFMVDGKMMLYKGIIVSDFGVLTASLVDVPRQFVLVYLIGVHAFSGLVELLRAMEARRYGGKNWRLKMGHGFVNVVTCIICVIFLNNTNTVVIVYALGILYSGVLTLASAFRRTAFVYIP